VVQLLYYSRMNKLIKGLYKHKNTGTIYKVIGVGRRVENANEIVVIYKSIKESRLKDDREMCGSIILPVGSIWIRDYTDFVTKFSPYIQARKDTLNSALYAEFKKLRRNRIHE
jgi:hypothetical protein